jgi:MFS transporter, Spinster family, sphingosine-1-phosphate transporter
VRTPTYRNYLLTLLLVILAFNYVDRLTLGLVLQDIKADFDLSDTQLGLLSGIAFALFYSLLGIPIARWADRGNRVTIISLTTALWCVGLAVCGVAGNFVQLLLIRIGIAVGEAGCIPPAHSLIADHFTRAERPRAVSRYMLGGPLSALIGYILAGWLNEFYGWRITFILLSLPGLVLAALAWLTLREPRSQQHARSHTVHTRAQPGFMEVCRVLFANATFRSLLLAYAIMSFFNYGIVKWQPTFFVRTFGLETGEIGTWFAVTYGLGGLLGTHLGGEWASRYAANNEPVQLKAMAGASCSFGIIWALIYLSSNQYVALGLMGLAVIAVMTTTGPLFATLQSLVPERMRATSIAFVYLFANLIGMGLGPLAVGMLSDVLRSHAGENSLRYALLLLCPGYFWAAWHLWRGSRTVHRDLMGYQ